MINIFLINFLLNNIEDVKNKEVPNNFYVYSESSDEEVDISNKETLPNMKSLSGNDKDNEPKLRRTAPLSTTNEHNEQEPITADNTDNDDYDEEEEEDDDDSSDSDAPKKVVLKIKPISEVDRSLAASPDVLRFVSKNLQLRFNKNENLKRRPLTTYTKNYNSPYSGEENMLKSKLGNESLSSFTSSILNAQTVSPCASLSSPTPWQESRSASALGFFPATLEERRVDLDLFNETSATMFMDQQQAPPPLPPLPITTQQKYQQRLNQLNAIKSEPIKINQTNKLTLSDNEFQMPANDDVMKF